VGFQHIAVQMLTGTLMGAMHPFHEVCQLACCESLFSGEIPDTSSRSQGTSSSLPNTMLACVVRVASLVDALQASKKRGSLSFQSLWCIEKTFYMCSPTVFVCYSTIPSNYGCRGVVCVLQIPGAVITSPSVI
jgi:hypothetical protein